MAAEEIITEKTVSLVHQRARNARGWIDARANQIRLELARGEEKPFDEVIKLLGDPHAFGQQPISSLRQLLSCLLCPRFLDDPNYPQDIREKAQRILEAKPGFSIASYTDAAGLRIIREHVAQFISKRDGYEADTEDIYLTSGGAQGIQIGLGVFAANSLESKCKAGVMIPMPGFSLYQTRCIEFDIYRIPYYLDEENDWALSISELRRALDEARPHCRPKALVLINPGNPIGQVLTYDNIRDVIKFCAQEKLVLFADEVYQETMYKEDVTFHSCRKVVKDLGPEYHKFQLMSINSVSKGFYGECCLRGAYIELVGFSDKVKQQIFNVTTSNLPPSIIGQAALSAMCNPPQPGDESYETFLKEKRAILDSYRKKAKVVVSMLRSLEGVVCKEINASLYAFPSIKLPRKAVEAAKVNSCTPDEFYCWQMLEETGITPIAGTHFGQKEGTHHFRFTILPSEEKIALMFDRITKFHKEFMQKYSDEGEEKYERLNGTVV
ncbi:PREDICTED: alanine aminotransferase 2-like [Acropora digitifera]|uniref:alanine aminotransferase 2-like n=1 Tax=Acropora digitifera TaxID=70779 RepID=UPI00077AAC20|nr:PREDICTED: alanine aminotransferase 2-like [Acropora digitifera]